MANTWCALHIWGQSRFYWVLININFIGTNIINIKDIPDVLCIWGQGRVCWGILKQRLPQKWSWLHGRFHPSPENMIIHLRYCCCLMLLLIYYSFVMYFLEFTINWYLQHEPLFQISLRLLLSAWAWFCNWKMSLSAWCPIQCKTVYILSEFYLGLWPRHVPVFFLSLIFFYIYC